MPSPTPVKIAPPARPRRAAGTCGSTVGAARTISTPPATPDARRQTKNHANASGTEQAKKAAVASSIMARRIETGPKRAASDDASSAPAVYPARLAAPRYAALAGANHPPAINAGSNGV